MLLLDKTLLRLSKGLWGWIFLIVLIRFAGLVATTKFALVVASYLGDLFHPSISGTETASAIRTALIAAIVLFFVQLLQGELEYRCTAQARTNLRSEIFSKVLELDAGNIEKIGPVSAITSSVDAVEKMQVYYSTYLPALLFSVIAPIYLFFQLKDISLPVALLLLIVSLVLLPLNNIFRYWIEHLRRKYWGSVEDMTAYYLDSLRGLTTLKLFERDKDHAQKLSEKANEVNTNINAFMKINFTSFLVTEALIYASIVIALVMTCRGLANHMFSVSSALTVLMLSYSYFSSIRQLMMATHSALTAVSAASKVEDILAVDTSRKYLPEAPEDPMHFNGIRMNHVSFSYEGRNQALKDVSLLISKGSVTALVGLSGCGKSTAASLLMRFMDPSSGNIYMEGKDYLSMRPEELRKKIIMVPQTVSLFSGTIRDNLKIASPNASDEELMHVLEEVTLKDFVTELPDGLDSDVGDAGAKLSGGQKQKIGIARALLSKAEYLIFDEATSAVDRDSEQEIWKCIEKISSQRTLIIISHRLSTIRNSDAIYVLNDGRIEESGKHEELMKNNSLYARLVQQQNELEGSLQ